MTTTLRFETLLITGDELAERRRRVMMSGLMASTLCLGAGTLAWVGDKMGIRAVTPPKDAYAITLDAVLTPPPPAAPPAAPAAAARAESKRAATPDPPDLEPDVAPLDVPKLDLDAAPARVDKGSSSSGSGDGMPKDGGLGPSIGGPSRSGATCLLPPCLGTEIPTRRPPKPPEPAAPALVPYNVAAAGAIYAPDPDQKKLGLTPTGRGTRRAGKTVVGFCIDRSGRTYDVRTTKRFGSDPQVDRICRETVSRWRFKPQRVGGKSRASCTAVTFDIRFD